MKKRICLILMLLLLVACNNSNNTTPTDKIVVEKLSIQELDDDQYIEKTDFEVNKNAINKFKIVNTNFKTVPKLDVCQDVDNHKTDNYVIENIIKENKKGKTKYSYKVYKKDDEKNKCTFVAEIKNSQVYNMVEFNNKLYLEVDNFTLSDKRNLVELADKEEKIVKADINNVNNFAVVDNALLISNGSRIDYVDAKGNVGNIKNPNKETKFYTIFSNDKTLYIMSKNESNNELYVSQYSFKEEGKDYTKLENYLNEGTKHFVLDDNESLPLIGPDVTKQTDGYIIFDKKMICKIDLSSCKYVPIEGEEIIDVNNNLVLYSSDRIYLSNFNTNTKEVILSEGASNMYMSEDDLVIKVMKKNDDFVYIKYKLMKE